MKKPVAVYVNKTSIICWESQKVKKHKKLSYLFSLENTIPVAFNFKYYKNIQIFTNTRSFNELINMKVTKVIIPN